jgi:hypothetical protein
MPSGNVHNKCFERIENLLQALFPYRLRSLTSIKVLDLQKREIVLIDI